MEYILYNAIKTPDGTLLWCENNYDYKSHTDKISGESYMNDGTGYSIRRSMNIIPYEDLSISTGDSFDKVRTAKFWGSYGKEGKSPKVILALEEMEDSHIKAILITQPLNSKTREVFQKELEYRIHVFKEHLEDNIEQNMNKNSDKKKNKI